MRRAVLLSSCVIALAAMILLYGNFLLPSAHSAPASPAVSAGDIQAHDLIKVDSEVDDSGMSRGRSGVGESGNTHESQASGASGFGFSNLWPSYVFLLGAVLVGLIAGHTLSRKAPKPPEAAPEEPEEADDPEFKTPEYWMRQANVTIATLPVDTLDQDQPQSARIDAAKQVVELTTALEAAQLRVGQLITINDSLKSTLSRYFSRITDIAYKSESLPLEFRPQPVGTDQPTELPDLLGHLEELEQLVLARTQQDTNQEPQNSDDDISLTQEELYVLKESSETAQLEIQSTQIELAQLRELIAERDNDLKQLGDDFRESEQRVANYQVLLTELYDKVDTVNPVIAPSPSEPDMPELNANDLSERLDELEQAVGIAEAQKVRLSNDAKQWHKRAENAEHEFETAQLKLVQLTEVYQNVQSEVEASRETLDNLQDTVTCRQLALEQLSEGTEDGTGDVSKHLVQITQAADKIDAIQIQHTPLDVDPEAASVPTTDLAGSLDELDKLLANVEEYNLSLGSDSDQWKERSTLLTGELEKANKDLLDLKEVNEKTRKALAASRQEIGQIRTTLKQQELEPLTLVETTNQTDARTIGYLSQLTIVSNKLASVRLSPNANETTEKEDPAIDYVDVTPSLDALEAALSSVDPQSLATLPAGEDLGQRFHQLEAENQSNLTTIDRLRRGIDQLRVYQSKVKNWDNTISGYRTDIKHKTQLIDSLRDENAKLRNLESTVSERDKSIATLVAALKHDADNIQKLKRRVGRWKRRCVLIENHLQSEHPAISRLADIPTDDALDAEPMLKDAQEKICNAIVSKDRPKGSTPGWVERQPSDTPEDDLTQISDVDDVLAETLFQAGVSSLEQLAKFTDNDIEWLAYLIDAYPTKIRKGKWIEQAQALCQKKTTAATEV